MRAYPARLRKLAAPFSAMRQVSGSAGTETGPRRALRRRQRSPGGASAHTRAAVPLLVRPGH
eukprot:15056120-Alexandrium_andersonii.AAC.1